MSSFKNSKKNIQTLIDSEFIGFINSLNESIKEFYNVAKYNTKETNAFLDLLDQQFESLASLLNSISNPNNNENITKIIDNPLLDSDIIVKTPKFSDPSTTAYCFDKENYNRTMQFILKRMSKCYMFLLEFKEADLCLTEAKNYVDDECPDIYFRKAQLKIYNKYSGSKELHVALGELNKALSRKVRYNQEILLKEHKKCCALIKKKEE